MIMNTFRKWAISSLGLKVLTVVLEWEYDITLKVSRNNALKTNMSNSLLCDFRIITPSMDDYYQKSSTGF